jgi:hypothetical protein
MFTTLTGIVDIHNSWLINSYRAEVKNVLTEACPSASPPRLPG